MIGGKVRGSCVRARCHPPMFAEKSPSFEPPAQV